MMAKKIEGKKKGSEDLRDPKQFCDLYENEFESDVILLVGQGGWQERVPAHSWVLSSGSDFFRALFDGPYPKSAGKIRNFPDDPPEGFNNFIRWLYQNKCELQSFQSSLDTLSVAIKYVCPDLADRCIIQLCSQLNVHNVLVIMDCIYCYCSSYQPPVPSAPSLEELDRDQSQNDTSAKSSLDPTVSCHLLLNSCLELIDKTSDQVLLTEHFARSDIHILRMMLRRDSLNLSSELKVHQALYKWSSAACKRQHLPLTMENRRAVLGDLLYLTRFLTLSIAEVESLYSKEGETCLLNDKELIFVDAFVKKISLPPVPYTMKDHISTMAKHRNPSDQGNLSKSMTEAKGKRKSEVKKRFSKKEIMLDLVSLISFIFD